MAVGESQLQRIIRDLHDAVAELAKEYKESGEPITDDSINLHKFSYKLEYLLQFDQKEKTTFLGTKKDYWDYFNDCLAKIKGANDGIRFVKSIPELRTSLGKGRAFIRYSLVHQRLADTLQQCLMNQRVTSDWYYARSPFLKPHLSSDIINHLYELTEVQFDVASRGHDLDASWPTFARRTVGSANSPGHMWKPPSRSSSINSLASSYSLQAPECASSPDYGHSLLNDLNDSLPVCLEDHNAVENLRLALDQSELKQRDLLDKVQQLGEESGELKGVIEELQRQLDVSLAAQEGHQDLQEELRLLQGRDVALIRQVEALRAEEKVKETQLVSLQEKLAAAEQKNMELMAKLDGFLDEKGQQAASHFDLALKIHELLDKLKEAEKVKMEAEAKMVENRRQVERLEEEVRVNEMKSKESETKLEALVTSLSEEKAKLNAKVEEQFSTLEMLQGNLALREKEANNLQRQLQDVQQSLEEKARKLEEVKRGAKQEIEEMQKNVDDLKESLEGKVAEITVQLTNREAELISRSEALQKLEAKNQILTTERDELTISLNQHKAKINEQAAKMEDYQMQCASLQELKEKLQATVSRNEEQQNEMTEDRAALQAELAALRASEKQLRGQVDDAKMTVDEKEKVLREENRSLDESLQCVTMAAKQSEMTSKRLEQENQILREELDDLKATLSRIETDVKNGRIQIEEQKKSLEASNTKFVSLQEQLSVTEEQLENKEKEVVKLMSTLQELEAKAKENETAKANAEATCAKQAELIERITSEKRAIETLQLERSSVQAKENQEVTTKLSVVEGQLEVSMKEVSRLQAEILDLKVQVQRSEEEKLKSQAHLEVAEGQRNELRSLTEQLKSQAEALNQKHIAELLECKKKEEALVQHRDREAAAHAELAISSSAVREELAALKAENNKLALENTEIREGLHRANTEMAELGMSICKLNAEREEASEHLAGDAAKIEELEKEVERIEERMNDLRQENNSLREELAQKESLPRAITELKEELDKAKNQVHSIKECCQEEMAAVKFQMSSETMSHQAQLKAVTENLEKVSAQLEEEQKNVSSLEAEVSELKAANEKYLQLIGEKDAYITQTEATIRENEGEIQQLSSSMASIEEAHLSMQTLCEELKQKLEATEAEKQSQYLTMSAEIEDLNSTKVNLEERLIELIKDKDALWQKSDALEFEQKLRAEERWWLVDKEATHCLGCNDQFTWWVRRHHCRVCGRIFCYNCSNNFVLTKHSGKKERCCSDCYMQHSAVVEKYIESEVSSSDVLPSPARAGPQPPLEPHPYKSPFNATVSDTGIKSDDGGYDIITEEEVNGVYDSDSNSQTTGGSMEGEQDRQQPGAREIGPGEVAPDDDSVPTVQDSEINLLRSGDVTLAVPLSVEDILQFGDGSRELFIKSSCYSTINITVADCETTIGWMFSSEPKSISLGVVYRESSDSEVEQAKVLIPLTRCNSHKETIQGQVKVRHPGLYTLIFDNSFSRFISKKVFYHLTMEKPVIYDGSDGP
ncbi:FYVE and coiled-coil domain-containing protein 1 [Poeciliopsis prolifica]|uniref:FYVE and coiled-coil domain-containing protein 1 n=1 Tax=Poeciliopsis prolifica TaxID=188132 RepID=UPI0024138317|nr:FYVE and coiled-coil domain-containing protein 1 [Poeciliopsis prolifica]XP_054908369.1 FYVE and coiled-coil domain-containing protein 1 [Poeciliopsis prolifica]XP_054908377.1 FYVE and coiled-coil domain-containing protein 1 [Poeciliopsis prolifica]XP_054908383.1 FYVE and coiled-coil domain-containing protein 1 [Poeciliopsis prolifica]